MKALLILVILGIVLRVESGEICGAGEHQCINRNCEFRPSRCASWTVECIWGSWLCDGRQDCTDGSDEHPECVPPKDKCNAASFRCANGDCIWDRLVCSGANDCSDASDETNCEAGPAGCDEAMFTCGNGKCIATKLECNGQDDCGDLSDESFLVCEGCVDFVCGGGECIEYKQVCDNNTDCIDGSDEALCHREKFCHEGEFLCSTVPVCIPEFYMCDGVVHCSDGSDESEFCSGGELWCPKACWYGYQCSDCRCINYTVFCDGNADCADKADESSCDPFGPECPEGEFFCDTVSVCIPDHYQCNGIVDCPDRSDEVYARCGDQGAVECPEESCNFNTSLMCKDCTCIPSSAICDGTNDCIDSFDEFKCPTKGPECAEGEFQCTAGDPLQCVNESSICDGIQDCTDGSDESRDVCSNIGTCNGGAFLCAHGWKCIRNALMCDGFIHCEDFSDEITDVCGYCPEFECDNHLCVTLASVCNANDDCFDGSDEGTRCEELTTTSESSSSVWTTMTTTEDYTSEASNIVFNTASTIVVVACFQTAVNKIMM